MGENIDASKHTRGQSVIHCQTLRFSRKWNSRKSEFWKVGGRCVGREKARKESADTLTLPVTAGVLIAQRLHSRSLYTVIGKIKRNFGCHDHWFFNFDVQISVSILCAVCRAIERGQQFYSKSIRRANPERLTIRKDFSLAQVVGVRSREKLKTNLHFPFCPDVFLRI